VNKSLQHGTRGAIGVSRHAHDLKQSRFTLRKFNENSFHFLKLLFRRHLLFMNAN
jgi:hypothetical protein